MFNLGTGGGWHLLNPLLADSDNAGHDALLGDAVLNNTYVTFGTSFTTRVTLNIEDAGFVDANDGGGLATTGGLTVAGSARVDGAFSRV